MYTNIHTGHGLDILTQCLSRRTRSQPQLPPDFNVDMIIEAATLVIHWNVFVHEDTYFRQMIGTAMDTPSAVLWAITYYYWHKKNILIPRYSGRSQMPLRVLSVWSQLIIFSNFIVYA